MQTTLFYLLHQQNQLLAATNAIKNSQTFDMTPIAFDSILEDTFNEKYRFTKQQILNIRAALAIPVNIKLENGCRVDGNLALCILLDKLAYPVRNSRLEESYGIHRSNISRIINFLLFFINDNWSHTLHLRQCHINEYQEQWAHCVYDRGAALDNCIGFIDGTCRQNCRPIRDQKSIYNGHKRYHCLKYQSVTAPNGLILDLSGPFIGIRHDIRILRESNLLDRLALISDQYVIYGDPAYSMDRNICCPYEGILTPDQLAFNQSMSRTRIAVEWNYARVLALFAGLRMSKSFKILLSPVGLYYRVAVILCNIHCCFNGNQISIYFNCPPMSLDKYLHICQPGQCYEQ